MISLVLSAVIAGSWTGEFAFDAPAFTGNGIPMIQGTVSSGVPGVPLYPVRTIFVPVPPGSQPFVRTYETASADAVGAMGEIPRAGRIHGEGLEALTVPVEPVDASPGTVELRGVYPIAGTSVAVVDIYPYNERGFFPWVSLTLEWDGEAPGVRMPSDHLLEGIAQGETIWPGRQERAESPFWGRPWARIAIEETGGCRITCQDLENAGCAVAGSPIETISLFSGPGTQFDESPETEHLLLPVSCIVEDLDGNGFFDNDDEVLFMAGALNRFEYDDRSLAWLYHRYATHRVYWLTWGGENGARMAQEQGNPDGSPNWGNSVDHRVHLEDGGH